MSAEATKRGRASRRKGQVAERQVAALIAELTGWTIKRRVRNHAGDSDLEGVPFHCVEVKDRAGAKLGDVREWWAQAVEQARRAQLLPVLFYKRQPGEWRAVWLLGTCNERDLTGTVDYWHTVEGSVGAWASVARELVAGRTQASPAPVQALGGPIPAVAEASA